jgi:poly-gamma-glutamate synthesis protein (capsule biosynthesis protein)
MTRLLFLGDVYLPEPYEVRLKLPEQFVFNLESPITTAVTGWPRKVNLKTAADHVLATFGRRPAAVCLANNHIMDYGAAGFGDTLAHLRAAGTPFFGGGTAADNWHNPAVIEVGSRRVALLGYVCPTTSAVFATEDHPGVRAIEPDAVGRDVRAARAGGADWVVVSLHWGVEEIELPKPEDVALARQLVDLGADLIIGHHAHCIQPFEVYRDKHIFYGLGNAIFPDLDVPSFFDDAGRSTRNFVKLQKSWNKRSLGVELDVETGRVSASLLAFDGRTLSRRADASGHQFAVGPLDAYARRFRRSFFFGTLRNKVVSYARSPKLPRARHLRSVVAILKESVWKPGT